MKCDEVHGNFTLELDLGSEIILDCESCSLNLHTSRLRHVTDFVSLVCFQVLSFLTFADLCEFASENRLKNFLSFEKTTGSPHSKSPDVFLNGISLDD